MGNSSNTSNTLLGIITGALAGYIFGVLYAPDKGENTRKKIAKGATEYKDTLVEKASEIKKTVVSKALDEKQNLDQQLETLVSNVSHKTEDVITALEKKLEALKKQNKKFQKS